MPRRPPVWPWIAAIFVAIAATAGITLAITSGTDNEPGTATPSLGVVGETQIRQAHRECSTGRPEDDDHTLVIDMPGTEYGSGTASESGFDCTMAALDVPQSVLSKMMSTRALDGMQSATWGSLEASWTYHPDDGLDLIITEK